ncbi:MAG: hypothetical protein CM1200mP1_00210 [Candidatus Neomarinimicrobiota bacterium]|nr:MAG: hypothetical protein CM1200mP1_00210 [Candidatus Neomarinimicrobiota bacterium]
MVARLLEIHRIAMVHIKNYNFIIIFCLIISLSNQGCENKYPEGTNIKIEVDDGLDHLFFLPNEYQEHREKEWPLILFLHGMGERGDNLELVKIHGIPKISEETDTFPFIAISPQCPIDHVWTDQAMQMDLIVLLESVIDNYRVDKDKIYVTGLSMGGYGTWSLLSERPDLFAAAVPICGGEFLVLIFLIVLKMFQSGYFMVQKIRWFLLMNQKRWFVRLRTLEGILNILSIQMLIMTHGLKHMKIITL